MKNKKQIARGELKKVLLNKDEVEKKIKEAEEAKVKSENELRKLRSKMSGRSSGPRSAKKEMKRMELRLEINVNSLKTLMKEQQIIAEDLYCARDSLYGAIQVIDALQFELKALESSRNMQ